MVRRNKPIDYVLTGLSFVLLRHAVVPARDAPDPVLRHRHPHGSRSEAPQGQTVGAILADPRGLVLPEFTLAAITIASFSRYMRSSMMEAMTEDYVRTARAKGAGPRRVLFRHALRNAIIPIITLLGLSIPAIVSGAVITETVFNFPGHGAADLPGGHQHRRPAAARDRRSWPRWRPSSARCWPTSSTPSSTRGSAMPSDRDRDASGSPWSIAGRRRTRAGPGSPVPPSRSLRLPERLAAAEGRAERRRGRLDRKHAPSDRVGLHREQAGRRRAGGDRLHGAVLLPGAGLLPHQPDQRPGGAASTPRQNTSPSGPDTCSAPTTPGSTSSAASCSAGRTRSSSGFAGRHLGHGVGRTLRRRVGLLRRLGRRRS